MRKPRAGGGFHALAYTFQIARRVGPWRLWRAMTSRNACKTCAVGMGGQRGGMRNEAGHFPEVCKKSLQAMAADMQGAVPQRFFRTFGVHEMQAMSPRELETAGRLVEPLYLAPGATHYASISWDAALAKVAGKLRLTAPTESFFYFSGRSSNEAGFLLQLFARVYGTNHVNNCSYYCHQASGVGLGGSIGAGTATVSLDDVSGCDTLFLIGGNPASNHPRLMTELMRLRRRGGEVIVVNPVRETGLMRFRVPSDVRSMLFGTEIASRFVQVHIGGDIAFLIGLAKVLLESHRDTVAEEFLAASTEGWAETRAVIEVAEWDDIVARSGVTRSEIAAVASVYARSERAIFAWTMGITHHAHGVENVQWIANLALMRGMVGKPKAGLLPIRGHSNVQGMGTVGVTPALRDTAVKRLADFGVKVPGHKGFDTMACMEAAHEGRMRFGWALGGNLQGSNPDAEYARTALAQLDLLVYLSTALNTGHAHGLAKETLILPVLARDEEPYTTTQESMFSYVRLSDGGKARHAGPRGEVDIIADVARRTLGDGGVIQWSEMSDADKVRELIARLVPGMEGMRGIGQSKQEFQIAGRALHGGRFPTATGKARLFPHPMPAARDAGLALMLMTARSEGQFNTVVYEDHDYYRGQERRDVILMHAGDIARLGLTENDRVSVSSAIGRMDGLLVRAFDIKPGNALMYYPEANVLVPRGVDAKSRTPAFKAVPINVVSSTGFTTGGDAVVERKVAGVGGMVAALLFFLRKRRRPKLNAC